MKPKKVFLTTLLSLAVLFGPAQAADAKAESIETRPKFSRIEQPLPLKILVTLGVLGLIGAELWWFLFSQTKSKTATNNQGIQELDIVVDGGYSPDRIVVNSGGQPVPTTSHDHNHHLHTPPEKVTEIGLKAAVHQGVQEMNIQVAKGYHPAKIILKAGLPVKLNFIREDENKCLSKVLIPDFNISLDLPLNKMVSVELTPTKPGSDRFTCGMEMFHGTLEVMS